MSGYTRDILQTCYFIKETLVKDFIAHPVFDVYYCNARKEATLKSAEQSKDEESSGRQTALYYGFRSGQ